MTGWADSDNCRADTSSSPLEGDDENIIVDGNRNCAPLLTVEWPVLRRDDGALNNRDVEDGDGNAFDGIKKSIATKGLTMYRPFIMI